MLLENESPLINRSLVSPSDFSLLSNAFSDDHVEEVELFEIFEHPFSLEELNVVSISEIQILKTDIYDLVKVYFTPTIPHCSMATLIGLCISTKLRLSLPLLTKTQVEIKSGSHYSEVTINKQLNDKERVAAALENDSLCKIVFQCFK